MSYIDPSGHKVWLIHGTWATPDPENGKPSTWKPDFVDYVEGLFNETSEELNWSGGNTNGARSDAAEYFVQNVYDWHKEHPEDPIRLVGHSHGGNVAIMLANLLAKKGMKVETLITIATPVRGFKLEKGTNVGQHIHLYNTSDGVQVNGGNIWNLGGVKRKFKGAENVEVEVPFSSNFELIDSHTFMHSNVEIWKEYIEPRLH